MLPDFILPLAKSADQFKLTWFSNDAYTLLIRMAVNIVFLTVLIRYLYYPKTKEKTTYSPIT